MDFEELRGIIRRYDGYNGCTYLWWKYRGVSMEGDGVSVGR